MELNELPGSELILPGLEDIDELTSNFKRSYDARWEYLWVNLAFAKILRIA